MMEPELVGDCMRAMAEAAEGTEVNVKCRLGVDQVCSEKSVSHGHMLVGGPGMQ